MAQKVLVRALGGAWHEPTVTAYVDEKELQALVAESPELLTGQPLATVSEFRFFDTSRADIVGVGSDGSITVVECKLSTNPEGRREVFGQLFSYAASLARMNWSEFAATWESRAKAPLLEHVASKLGVEVDADEFRSSVEANLRAGDFTLVVAVDDITAELKRIIEYANSVTRSDVTVLGLELQLARDAGTEILVPRLWGESVAESKRSRTGASHQWTAEAFAARIADLDEETRPTVEALMAYGQENGIRPYWGTGQEPRMSWWFKVGGTEWSLYQVRLTPGGPTVAIHFSALGRSQPPGPAVAAELLARLKANPTISPYLDGLTDGSFGRVPVIPIRGGLARPGTFAAFADALDSARSVTGA